MEEFPRIIYPEGFDPENEADVSLIKMKGYFGHLIVQISEEREYLVYFSDPVLISQDLLCWTKQGYPCFAPPGLIIVNEVTPSTIEQAVKYLWQQGYFDFLCSVKGKGYDDAFQYIVGY